MNARKLFSSINVLVVIMILVSACQPALNTFPQVVTKEVEAGVTKEVVVQPDSFGFDGGGPAPAAQPMPTAAPRATQAPASQADNSKPGTGVQSSPYRQTRLIIKNGEMTLQVADTDRALDQATSVAVDTGGYVVASKTWLQDSFKYAQLTMGVPVDQFEVAQRRLRGLAVQVLSDTASGQDVSDEYVDLQSRLTNLEATAARIREFLADAKTVEEALKVNAQLTEVENEIEQIKGRMNYLKDRSAYSTLVVTLEPQRPTPTPTSTPTPTPTPTPAYWQPDKTVKAAGDTLSGLLQALGDVLIWLGIVVVPFAIPVAIVVALVAIFRRKNRKPSGPPPSSNAG